MKAAFTIVFAVVIHVTFGQQMDFVKYSPKSTLIVPTSHIQRAKFPFIDIHNHQWNMPTQNLTLLTSQMDSLNMAVMINLSGRSGESLNKAIENVKTNCPNRVLIFANLDFSHFGENGWTVNATKQLETDVRNGAKGLKIFENLGTNVKDQNGSRVRVDDTRLDPIWRKCGELRIPVLIHTAAPNAFWEPFDEKNERWLELSLYPERIRTETYPAPFDSLIAEQHRMFKKHRQTNFIAAHFNWHANDLETLGHFLDDLPNMYVEFGAVIAELGRQPRNASKFFTKYQDRILFGKDSWVPSEYQTYFRVLESDDEYFPYHKKYHAFWSMYGLELGDDILKKIYFKNALKLLPDIDRSLFPK